MGEHYAESAIGATVSAWCGRCGRYTDHVIARHSEHAGKLGHCIDPKHPAAGGADGLSAAQRKKREKTERARQNPRLF